MTSLVILPRRSDAFQNYKPSRNAHTDILSATPQPSAAGSVIRISLPSGPPEPSLDDETEELTRSIPLILAGKPIDVSYHRLADISRRVALDSPPHVAKVRKCIDDKMRVAAENLAREGRAHILSLQDNWLVKLADLWDTFQKRVSLLAALLVYIDRVTMKEIWDKSTSDFASAVFKSYVWESDFLRPKTVNDLLAWAASERQSGVQDEGGRAAAHRVVQIAAALMSFGFFDEYKLALLDYHESQVAEHNQQVEAGSLTGTGYIEWARERELDEEQRVSTLFDGIDGRDVYKTDIQLTMRRAVVSGNVDMVVSKALDEALYRADTAALQRLYTFCGQTMSIKTMVKALQEHIVSRITTIISDPANDPQMIDSCLKLKRFVDGAVGSLFAKQAGHIEPIQATAPKRRNDLDDEDADMDEQPSLEVVERERQLDIEDAVRTGFKLGLRSRQNAPAEWIAKHLDATMRKGQGSSTEEDFNALLDEIIALVGFTPDKDVFRAFYATGLAKRLLLNKSASDDMERNMILKLQRQMGEEFTSGDVMMKDLQLSETLVKSYQSARAKNPSEFKDHSDFTANVLTEAAWPPYPLLKDGWDFKLTPQLQSSVDTFTEWYATQHKNRKLSWRHQLASATLTARFDSGKYEVGVSLFQAVVLLQFNDAEVLSFEEIKSRTGIESSELVRTLQSLSLGRKGTRVLVKRPAGKEVDPTDKFAINKGFSSERMKFKINQIQQDLSAEESRKTNEQVALDRVSILEATIVRIMKGRKQLSLTLLVDAVVSDVAKRFPPDVKEIKKRVESLIEREFLRRSDEDRQVLQYLA